MAVESTSERDSFPEADRLAGFPHPRATERLFGHAEAQHLLLDAYQKGLLHHAWLMTGPEGIGKATLAYQFAKFILAKPVPQEVCPEDLLRGTDDTQAARLVRALSHPNLMVLRRPYMQKEKRLASAILVAEVRKIKSFLGMTAGEENWRIVIVDQADDLNKAAANALLKSLEEPPRKTIFLLLTAHPGQLPATLRSRCRLMTLNGLSPPDLRRAMENAYAQASQSAPNPEDLDGVIKLARGSVRQALNLLSGNGLKLYGQIQLLFQSLPKADFNTLHDIAENLAPAKAEEDFEMFFFLLAETLRTLVLEGARGANDSLDKSGMAGVFQKLTSPQSLGKWACLWQTILAEKHQVLALNLDRKAFILGSFQRLLDTANAEGDRP